jgi:hypothetical protein
MRTRRVHQERPTGEVAEPHARRTGGPARVLGAVRGGERQIGCRHEAGRPPEATQRLQAGSLTDAGAPRPRIGHRRVTSHGSGACHLGKAAPQSCSWSRGEAARLLEFMTAGRNRSTAACDALLRSPCRTLGMCGAALLCAALGRQCLGRVRSHQAKRHRRQRTAAGEWGSRAGAGGRGTRAGGQPVVIAARKVRVQQNKGPRRTGTPGPSMLLWPIAVLSLAL